MWAREDLNLHGLLRTHLKRMRLPISPRARLCILCVSSTAIYYSLNMKNGQKQKATF